MDFQGLPARLARVRGVVAERQAAGGWSHDVRIVAVTKTHPPAAVVAAVRSGLTDVGENRVQEALEKQGLLGDVPVSWHLIGSLQRNKARHAVGRFALIHSVDRLDLAGELGRRAGSGARQPILVQVNCSGEPQKGGIEPQGLDAMLDGIAGIAGVEVRGLMTMSALTDDPREQRRAFRLLRESRDRAELAGHRLPELSMGMSGDYPVAVEEGATMIRLGTVLFGERAGA
ncbi:MAG: YggS family pyridoxal phosphate-dependent enzyme [Gemmatimonadales bacterium]